MRRSRSICRVLRLCLVPWGALLLACAGCVTVQTNRESLEARAEVATFQRDWTKAADLWHRVWQLDEGRDVRSSYETARALLEGGDPRGALAIARAGLRHHPDDASLHELAGRAEGVTGNRVEAALDYERALEREPGRLSALKALGSLRFELGEFTPAAEVLARAHAADPEDGEVAFLLARSYEAGGHSLSALAAYESAYRTLDASAAQLWRAARLAFGDVDAPICPEGYGPVVTGWLERACAIDPQAVEAHLVLGRLYQNAGRDTEAVVLFERVVEVEPTHAAGLEALARALLASGDPARARRIATHALSAVGEDERAPFTELLAEDPQEEADPPEAGALDERTPEEQGDSTDAGPADRVSPSRGSSASPRRSSR